MDLLKKSILIMFVFVISNKINAQENCSQKFRLAKELYESGQLEEIPALLDSCFSVGFGNDLDIQAYILLMQTYLFDYNRDQAMNIMHKFLKKYPEYHFADSTSVEIKEIYDSYKILPNWGLEINAGTTCSDVYSTQNFSVYDLNYLNSEYKSNLGVSVNLIVNKYLGYHWSISSGAGFKSIVYENTETDRQNSNQTQFKETASWLTIPLNFSYYLNRKNLTPYIFAGAEFGYLLNCNGSIKYTVNNSSESVNASFNELRNPIQISAVGGVGLRYHIPKGFLKFWIGYNHSNLDYIKNSKRYSLPESYFKGHIDDDIKYNSFFMGIAYTRTLFKIKTAKK